MNYFNQEPKQVIKSLDTTMQGLSSQEVQGRLETNGYNELREGEKKSTFQLFLEQFKDFLIIILIIAAGVSFAFGEKKSAVTICVVLILNAILGVVQQKKADSSMNSLKKLSAPTAKVIRDGQTLQIPARELVVGDIVTLDAGDYIPADGRILESSSLQVIESSLTGESTAVDKQAQAIEKEDVALGDLINMVFSSGLVTYGRAKYAVTETGMDTQIGKIATLIQSAKERKTPLQERLDDFSKKLGIGIVIISIGIFALNMFRDAKFIDAFMFAVALAVAAIPEALASIVTIVMAVGTNKMATKNAIVKKLPAVETLGGASIICSDKTGTLTQNKMTVAHTFTLDGEDLPLERRTNAETMVGVSILANDSSIGSDGKEIGDPTETALLNFAIKNGMDRERVQNRYGRLGDLPFDSDRKLMSTLHKFRKRDHIFTKGAPDILLGRSTRVLKGNEIYDLTEEERNIFIEQNYKYSSQGLRVLAFAMTEHEDDFLDMHDEKNYVFIGLIAMIDPPREEVKGAIVRAKKAGIRTIMITGDHKITASAIAQALGIMEEGDIAVDSIEFDEMSEAEYAEKLEKISVYARVSPEHKIRIVQAWQDREKIVAMTGDGVNDAPALKQADIGVAMGITGTDVSKDAAAMVLADDNFATIIEAVSEGRAVYANIKRAIQFLLSGNLGGILVVLYAALLGLPNPFSALHLLFINLVTDSLPAIALAFEPADETLMDAKP
ncbi:MAG: HAD-IC family P-type ATPase, partial [Proteocatella sp.]